VLTGGGARGAYQAGVITGLAQRGEEFDLVCGTSIGAVNGALIAQGAVGDLHDFWSTIARRRIVRPIPSLEPLLLALQELNDQWRGVISRPVGVAVGLSKLYDHGKLVDRTGFLEPGPIQRFLREHLDMSAVRVPFAFAATNLTTARSEVFTVGTTTRPARTVLYKFWTLDVNNAADRALYPEIIRASTAVPLAFPPVALQPRGAYGENDYVDGGIALNAPVALARSLGAAEIVAVAVDPPRRPRRIEHLADVIFGTLESNQLTLVLSQLEPGAGPIPLRRVGLIQPAVEVPAGVLDFNNQDRIDASFAQGVADGLRGPSEIPINDPAQIEKLIEEPDIAG